MHQQQKIVILRPFSPVNSKTHSIEDMAGLAIAGRHEIHGSEPKALTYSDGKGIFSAEAPMAEQIRGLNSANKGRSLNSLLFLLEATPVHFHQSASPIIKVTSNLAINAAVEVFIGSMASVFHDHGIGAESLSNISIHHSSKGIFGSEMATMCLTFGYDESAGLAKNAENIAFVAHVGENGLFSVMFRASNALKVGKRA
jgi:hypothetical protein